MGGGVSTCVHVGKSGQYYAELGGTISNVGPYLPGLARLAC